MGNRPLIGITASEMRHCEPPYRGLYALGQRYVSAVEETGGIPVILPPGLSEDSLQQVFGHLSGLLLSGGGDVNPTLYGEQPHPAVFGLSAERDRVELALARWAVEKQKPVLSICRGIQVLNVALGGSLVQDIPSQVSGALQHSFDDKLVYYDYVAHPVKLEPNSHVANLMGTETVRVNSWHHQCINHLAADLKVVGRAPDGVVEAVEISTHRFAIGVQWHPEWLYDQQPSMKRLFAGLVEAASNGR